MIQSKLTILYHIVKPFFRKNARPRKAQGAGGAV